jgi:hypothetical protein
VAAPVVQTGGGARLAIDLDRGCRLASLRRAATEGTIRWSLPGLAAG